MESPGFSRRGLLGAVMAGGALAMTTAALGRVTAAAERGEPDSADDYVLWFNEPATLRQEHAFPVGNGRADPEHLSDLERGTAVPGAACGCLAEKLVHDVSFHHMRRSRPCGEGIVSARRARGPHP